MCRRENRRWGMNSLDYLLSRRAATMAGPWLSHGSSLLVLASLCCPVSFLSQIRAQLLYVFNSHCAQYCMVIYLSLRGMPHLCPLQLCTPLSSLVSRMADGHLCMCVRLGDTFRGMEKLEGRLSRRKAASDPVFLVLVTKQVGV